MLPGFLKENYPIMVTMSEETQFCTIEPQHFLGSQAAVVLLTLQRLACLDSTSQDRHKFKIRRRCFTALHTRFTRTGMASAREHQSCVSATGIIQTGRG